MKIIDISVTISEDIKEPLPTKIVYEDHKEGAKKMGGKLFEGLTDVFVEGNGPAGEFLSVTRTIAFNKYIGQAFKQLAAHFFRPFFMVFIDDFSW